MRKIAWFSTDWTFERVPDEVATARTGKTVFVPNKRQASYGGTYYYRMAMPAMELAHHGYDCVLSWAVENAPDGHIRVMGTDGQWHDDCDIVVFQRWMHEDGAERARRAIACGQVVVNDIDDYFWALPKTNVASKTTDPRRSKTFNRDHYRKMLAASSALICSTGMIANALSRLGPPVHICRNAIDIDRWSAHDPGSNGMVGWVGGITWRGNDLPLLRGILGPFLEEHGLPFYHGGDSDDPNYPKAWEQLGLDLTVTQVATNPILPIAKYPHLWDPVNIALIPLENCTFNIGKSWLKSLEASACGVPYIASNLPEQRRFVEDGGMGRLAKTPHQWRAHLEDLLDPEVRQVEGAANRAHAEEWAISKKWEQWDAVFQELMPSPSLAAVA